MRASIPSAPRCRATLVAALVVCSTSLAGCAPEPCRALAPTDLLPAGAALFGVNLDWAAHTLAEFTEHLGASPAVAVQFSPVPMTDQDEVNVRAAAEQSAAAGTILLLTLEPHDGLAAVTGDVATQVAELASEINATGVPVIVRFAHEMNGSWYPWGQQPAEYVRTFRTLADAVHAAAPATQMMWAPNYGGGYPFAGGQHEARPGTEDAVALDTDRDGTVSAADDPYAPYYPGDDAVDWSGMSLYHWGADHPWGENEMPEPGKLVSQLTGTYSGAGGDDTSLPDFHREYGVDRGVPLAIPETAALVTEGTDPATALDIKRAWWQQVLSDATLDQLPALRMVNWFDWAKHEPEVGGRVDWTVTADPAVARAFVADAPTWVTGERLPTCSRGD